MGLVSNGMALVHFAPAPVPARARPRGVVLFADEAEPTPLLEPDLRRPHVGFKCAVCAAVFECLRVRVNERVTE